MEHLLEKSVKDARNIEQEHVPVEDTAKLSSELSVVHKHQQLSVIITPNKAENHDIWKLKTGSFLPQ